jgi:CelD/BcsL family acetyltransferase involved in cellulose biosynthesis
VSDLTVREFQTTDELRAAAGAWDDLWLRSDVANPAARADMVALWVDYFRPRAAFRALAVERNGTLLAALPFVGRSRLKGLIRCGSLPGNCWGGGEMLLVDRNCDRDAVMNRLIGGLDRLPWPILSLGLVSHESTRWCGLIAAAERAGLSTAIETEDRIGQVAIEHDWPAYLARLKGDHRRSKMRYARKLDEAGGGTLDLLSEPAPDEIEPLLRRAFDVEDRSWKSEQGSSVLRMPGAFEYYCREARLLAQFGHVELAFLQHRGQTIAFDYGWSAKGVHYTVKLGYDDGFAKFGPGQLMVMRLLERLHADRSRRLLDFIGPLRSFHADWATSSYPVGRLTVATPGVLSGPIFRAMVQWKPRVKRLRQRLAAATQTWRSATQLAATQPTGETAQPAAGRKGDVHE